MSHRRLLLRKKLECTEIEELRSSRMISENDGILLGQLMYAAYQGAIDYDGETLEQSIGEMEETLRGKYGVVNFPASSVVLEGTVTVSAVIFVYFEKESLPLLAYSMTASEYRGRKLSQTLIRKGMNVLYRQDYQECCLVVTEGNQPAQSIYEKLGFSVR